MTVIELISLRPYKAALARVTDPISPTLYGHQTEFTAPVNLSAIVLCCLSASIGLFIVVLAQGAGRQGDNNTALYLFWLGMAIMLIPPASRIALPFLARSERLFLIMLLGEYLFLNKLCYSPTRFVDFDEMLHWMTAYDILHRQKLFLDNSLLPVSPFYPALEILTTALANLIGVDVFPAAIIMLVVLRGSFVLALFLFFERLTNSARIAGIATAIYMGSSTFAMFDSCFAYESLAIVLWAIILLSETRVTLHIRSTLIVPAMMIATLAVTHHMTSGWCALYLSILFAFHAVQRNDNRRSRLAFGLVLAVAVFAISLPLFWMNVPGNTLVSYMGPILEQGLDGLFKKLSGDSQTREMFVTGDGVAQPLGNQLIGFVYTIIIAIGLATGFCRSLTYGLPKTIAGWSRLLWIARRKWGDSRVVLLTICSFGFPISVAFRLSDTGWEIGNRMNAFVFISVGLVVAIALVHYWQARVTRTTLALASFVVSTILLGGVIVASGPRAIHTTYRVGADADSIDALGIETARWTKEWLGAGNRFAADRVNRTLLATYGDQNIISSMDHGIDESRVFLDEKITPETLWPIRSGRIEYLYVDLRLTLGRAVLGEYYERHETLKNGLPPEPEILLKFDEAEQASRVYDNGYIAIYDVRNFRD